MGRGHKRAAKPCAVCGLIAALPVALGIQAQARAQTADIQLVALASPSASDMTTTLPTSENFLLNNATFVVEVWAQTTEPSGLSSVSADITFGATFANVTAIVHSATFDVLTHGTIDNVTGTVDDLSGSHLGPCTDAVGVAPNWARVAYLDVTALASGVVSFQSGLTGSAIYGTAICGEGDVPDAQISFGLVTVTLVDCLSDPDCDNGQYCDGAEICDLGTHTCQEGSNPSCDDQIDCTDDACDPLANGGAGGCANAPNDAHCSDSIDCTIDACDQLGAPGTGCSYTPDHTTCDDQIGCTDDACDQLGVPGTGCSNTPNPASCDDLIDCTDDACDQLGAPGTGCSNVANDANCTDSIDCTDDACDQLGAPGTGCSYTPNHSFCDDLIACTDDACDQLGAPGTGCSNIANDANCDNGLFCDGFEFCDSVQGCLAGTEPCTAECEHCVEEADSCEWCIFDLDGSGVMGTGDFSLFAPCFGTCYPPGDPCLESNFDQDPSGCVGTSDFAAFVGCFGDACGACAGCNGPGGGRSFTASANILSPVDQDPVRVRIIPRRSPSKSDTSETAPISDSSFAVGDYMFLEIWMQIESGDGNPAVGLASAYVDLRFDHRRTVVTNIVPSEAFGLFAEESGAPTDSVLRAIGGCTSLGALGAGGGGDWVRTATVVVRATRPGRATFSIGPSDELHGFSRVGTFRNIESSLIEFEGLSIQIGKKHRALRQR